MASERELAAEAEAEAEAESIASSLSNPQDATAKSLRELLGIRDSREYESFMRDKVSGKGSTLDKDRRFPRLVGHHDMSLSNELSLTFSDESLQPHGSPAVHPLAKLDDDAPCPQDEPNERIAQLPSAAWRAPTATSTRRRRKPSNLRER